jgi:hypothetical protein
MSFARHHDRKTIDKNNQVTFTYRVIMQTMIEQTMEVSTIKLLFYFMLSEITTIKNIWVQKKKYHRELSHEQEMMSNH